MKIMRTPSHSRIEDGNFRGQVWYNFVTEQYDELEGAPQDDDVAVQYLPRYRPPGLSQDAPTSSWRGPAVTLYKLYRDDGDSVEEAMMKVLVMCSGRKRAAGKEE